MKGQPNSYDWRTTMLTLCCGVSMWEETTNSVCAGTHLITTRAIGMDVSGKRSRCWEVMMMGRKERECVRASPYQPHHPSMRPKHTHHNPRLFHEIYIIVLFTAFALSWQNNNNTCLTTCQENNDSLDRRVGVLDGDVIIYWGYFLFSSTYVCFVAVFVKPRSYSVF